MTVLTTDWTSARERYLAPLPSNISARDVAAEMLGLLKFFAVGGLVVLVTAVNQDSSVVTIGILLAVSASYITSWVWWTKAVESGRCLVPSAVIFALLSIAAFVLANNAMGLMLIWSATAVVYLTFSPIMAFLYCTVPVALTLLVHIIGGSSFTRIIMEGTVALLLVTIGFQLCVSARDTSAASVERAQAIEKLRRTNAELSAALQHSRDVTLANERSRVAASLHNSLGHRLTMVTMGLEYATRMRFRVPDKAWSEVEQTRANVSAALEEMRVVVRALHPIKLDGKGLKENLIALASSFKSTRLAISTKIDDIQLDPRTEEILVAVTQEALTNIVRHSRASKIELTLKSHLDEVELSVLDDGQGTDEPFGFGLRSLKERVSQAAGCLSVDPHGGIGGGFALTVRLRRKSVDEYANNSYR